MVCATVAISDGVRSRLSAGTAGLSKNGGGGVFSMVVTLLMAEPSLALTMLVTIDELSALKGRVVDNNVTVPMWMFVVTPEMVMAPFALLSLNESDEVGEMAMAAVSESVKPRTVADAVAEQLNPSPLMQ